jgi:competence protein ComEC
VRTAAAIGGIAVAIAAAVVPPRIPDAMEVTFLAVGQGDASVVRFANGGVVLVDTGPERAGRRVIVPFLRSLGVRRIDAIAISHAHPDHTGGLADVVRAFPVGELWLAGPVGGDSGLDAAAAPLAARHTRVVQVGAGAASRAFGEARVDFLAGEASERADKRNDRSVVLRASDPRWSVLFPGDLERAGEDRLVASGARLLSDVVKAPHHGSSTSSTTAFIRASAPRLAIAQTGLGNRFGFPHGDVTARWRAAGSGWLDTAQEGAITVAPCFRRICAWSFVDPDRPVGY